jgi:hypothetical protein
MSADWSKHSHLLPRGFFIYFYFHTLCWEGFDGREVTKIICSRFDLKCWSIFDFCANYLCWHKHDACWMCRKPLLQFSTYTENVHILAISKFPAQSLQLSCYMYSSVIYHVCSESKIDFLHLKGAITWPHKLSPMKEINLVQQIITEYLYFTDLMAPAQEHRVYNLCYDQRGWLLIQPKVNVSKTL